MTMVIAHKRASPSMTIKLRRGVAWALVGLSVALRMLGLAIAALAAWVDGEGRS